VTYHWTYRTRASNQKCIIPENLLHRYCPNGNIGASSVAFNHKGNLLAIGAMESVTTSSSSHSLKIFNVDNLNAEDMTEINRAFDEGILLHNHYCEITDISWSDDDKYIASTSSSDKTIQVCKLNDNNQTISLSIFFPPKTHPICIAFTSPWHYNSKNEDIATMMISGSSDGSVQLWGVNDQILNAGDLGGIKHHDSSVNIIRVDCISKRIYTGDSNGCIIIWKRKITDESNIRRGSDFMILRRLDKLKDVMGKSIVGLSLSSEGTQIELGHDDGEEKNEEQHSLSTRRNQLLITTHHSGKGVSCRLHIFDLVSQLMISDSIETKSQKVAKYAPAKFSPDGGRLILSGSDDGRIHIWDTLSGKREKVSNDRK
jgi:WD40 repeat protein